jgi:hypothetical protein
LAQWEQFRKGRNKEEERKNARKRLTLTGLLMEGVIKYRVGASFLAEQST